jgi:Ca2+-binding RTX toxin-like protein
LTVATGSLAPSASHAAIPANDNFDNPQIIGNAGQSQTSGNTLEATSQAGEPIHAGVSGGKSIWYSYTAPVTGTATFVTDGSDYDTVLAAYTGNSVNSLTTLASNDDTNGLMSQITFWATTGTTYRIAVDGYRGSSGSVRLAWWVEPQDPCTIRGTSGNDVLVGTSGDDVICGYEGNDSIKGQGGNDTVVGGPGVDIVDYSDATSAVIANLTTGAATGQGTDTLQQMESIMGSPHNDKLDGDSGPNLLQGAGGSDGVWGQAGNDQVSGGIGNDTVGGGIGNDRVNGGTGADTAHFGKAAGVSVDLTAGTASGEGTDTLAAFENVSGSRGADTLRGGTGNNVLQGSGGNDTLFGFGGNDQLYGASGNDALTGGDGVDRCDGGTESDTATTCETKIAIP